MSDTRIPIFNADGQSAYIDYRTESSNGDGRQVVVLGDPDTNAAVADVQSTDPISNTYGLVVRDVNTSAIAGFLNSSLAVYLQSTAGTLSVQLKPGTIAVSLDPGHLLGSVTANAGTGTMTVAFDPGHELGSIKGINNTIEIYHGGTAGTLAVQLKAGTLAVSLDPGHLLGSVTANAGTGSFNVQFDPGHTLGKVEPGVGTFQVYLPDTGHELGSIRGITNSINIYLGSTAGSLGVRVGQIDGSVAVYFSQSKPIVLADTQGTASIFTASGTAAGVSVSGNTIISPSANASFKVYAFSVQTTGQVSLTTKFTNGAGTSPTEYFRPLITASGVTGAQGANLSTGGPGRPLFATGVSTTLSLVLDSATLVHYSVSYTKESA